jgi:hypothetical protein
VQLEENGTEPVGDGDGICGYSGGHIVNQVNDSRTA